MPTGMVTMYCRTSIAAVLFVLWEFRRISHCLVPPHPTQTTNQQGNITDVTAVKFPPVFPNFSLQEFFAVKVDRKAAPLKCSNHIYLLKHYAYEYRNGNDELQYLSTYNATACRYGLSRVTVERGSD